MSHTTKFQLMGGALPSINWDSSLAAAYIALIAVIVCSGNITRINISDAKIVLRDSKEVDDKFALARRILYGFVIYAVGTLLLCSLLPLEGWVEFTNNFLSRDLCIASCAISLLVGVLWQAFTDDLVSDVLSLSIVAIGVFFLYASGVGDPIIIGLLHMQTAHPTT